MISDEEKRGEAVESVASIFGGLRQMVEPWRTETEALKKRIAELEKRIEAMELQYRRQTPAPPL